MFARGIERFLPSPLVVMAFLFTFFALYMAKLPVLGDEDISWHIAAGDLIRSLGHVPKTNPWSYAAGEQTWYNISWLWDVLLSIIHEYAGIKGFYVFAIAMPALLMALLMASLQARGGIHPNSLLFTGFISLFTIIELASGRPQVIGLMLLLFFHHVLHKSRQNRHARSLWLLPPLVAVWVNLHGNFLAGLSIIGAYGLEALITKNQLWFRRLFLVGLMCLPAMLINPYGFDIVTAVSRTLHSHITQYISEWKPFVFGHVIGASAWLVAFALLSNMRDSRVPLADKIIAVIWVLAMLTSVRNVAVLVVAGAPYLALSLPVPASVNAAELEEKLFSKRFSARFLALVPLLVAGVFALLPYTAPDRWLDNPSKSPKQAIDYIQQHCAGKRLLADYDFGGRIIYETKGDIKVFVDGRAGTAYDEQALKDIIAITYMEKNWRDVIRRYEPELLLLKNDRPFVQAFARGEMHDEWRQIFYDEAATLYIKKNKRH